MATGTPSAGSSGYLSSESKRRFTLIAGILGAVFFVAQFVLPILAMFLLVMPRFMRGAARSPNVEQSAIWRGELWLVERSFNMRWDESRSAADRALRHVRLDDLASGGPSVPFVLGTSDEDPALLPIGDRLWLVGDGDVGYFQGGEAVVRLAVVGHGGKASRPFAYQDRPSRITLGTRSRLETLVVDGGRAEWRSTDLPLDLPPERGALRSLQALDAGGHLVLFAELCTADPERCSLAYREAGTSTWLSLVDDTCSCAKWTVVTQGTRAGVVTSESSRQRRVSAHWIKPGGVEHEHIELDRSTSAWIRWRALSLDDRLALVGERMPGDIALIEVFKGRTGRSVRTKGDGFPFPPGIMVFMWIPQLLPIVLSLLLALLLTSQMKRHRVQEYVHEGQRRRFASLWQRALAQLVDAVGLALGLLLPMSWWLWHFFADPDSFFESGPQTMLWMFAAMAASLLSSLLVLVAYSYWEGTAGKTPGKWLLDIRVVGTDLRPCGFGRALLRNLLTFVDGFFNFLVGVLLVALTEQWQRLGDLAARTIVVVDEKAA